MATNWLVGRELHEDVCHFNKFVKLVLGLAEILGKLSCAKKTVKAAYECFFFRFGMCPAFPNEVLTNVQFL